MHAPLYWYESEVEEQGERQQEEAKIKEREGYIGDVYGEIY